MDGDRRRHCRVETSLPVRFNLNPDYHVVPGIRKMGVGGRVHNVSAEGLLIDSQLDLLDLCQIFPEALSDHSPFELEVTLTNSRERRALVRGTVRWYSLGEPERKIRRFKAGLYLKDAESRAIARSIVETIRGVAWN